MGTSHTVFGMVSAGEGTHKSANDPANPSASDARAILVFPPGIALATPPYFAADKEPKLKGKQNKAPPRKPRNPLFRPTP